VTSQGTAHGRFQRAIRDKWVFHAELAARELGSLTLSDALKLVLLYAEAEPAKFERAAVRWLGRYLTEGKNVSLLKAHIALAALGELRSGESKAAVKLLTGLDGQPGKDGAGVTGLDRPAD
jgi:hypothetical protein